MWSKIMGYIAQWSEFPHFFLRPTYKKDFFKGSNSAFQGGKILVNTFAKKSHWKKWIENSTTV